MTEHQLPQNASQLTTTRSNVGGDLQNSEAIPFDGKREAQAAEELLELRARLKTCVHDLRNALAVQTAAIHLLTKAAGDPNQVAAFGRGLLEQCQKSKDLVDQLARIVNTDTPIDHEQPQSKALASDRVEHTATCISGAQRRQRILVVDDNIDVALTLAAVLRIEGYEVTVAHDGTEAVRITQSSHPDIVVLDIEMPLINGYETARRIRQECSFADCKLIAVSGHSGAEDSERSFAAGFHAYLTKPIDLDTLVRLF